ARGDYLIHRDGAKIFSVEHCYGFVGNERLQNLGGSSIAVFDIILFIAISLLAKILSPYPIFDASVISIVYWVSMIVSAVMIWLATILGKRHQKEYESVLSLK
ncbi:MAG: hypothetical protein M3Q64_01345, partial [bacterium]|nr:hypothetical protein [bacterium]